MSANYLASKFCRAELHAAFMRDPLNDSSGLVIVRIDGCDVPDLYQPISRIELVGLAGEQVRTFFLGKIRELPPATRPKRKPNSTAPASTTPLTIPPPATTNIQALGDRSIAAGRDVHVTYRESSKPRGRAKPPADVITEEQAVRLKQLVDELIELDRTEYGADLTEAQLRQKWWGALLKKVPATTYTNYSQRKFQRALKWCREQRGRLVSGQQEANPSAFRQLATRAIHAFITSRKLDKLTYYAELSRRLEIEPAFVSTTKLSDANLRRVYGAVQRDTRRS
jgi:hypothetical protein